LRINDPNSRPGVHCDGVRESKLDLRDGQHAH
jgi:hypothetical protein